MRKLHASLVTAMVAGLVLACPANAQPQMQWQQRESEGRILLAYELPETGVQTLLLVCDTNNREFSLRYHDDRDRVRDGMQAQVSFASEGGRTSLGLRAEQQELGDQVLLQGKAALDRNLVAILNGRTLHVTLSDATETIPLAGAKAGVAALVAGCGAR